MGLRNEAFFILKSKGGGPEKIKLPPLQE